MARTFKNSVRSLKIMKLHNPDKFEVLAASGIIKGCMRKLVVTALYIPPNYSVGRGRGAMRFTAAAVLEAKRKYDNPVIILAGDFNQWDMKSALRDFPDIYEVQVGPARGDRAIDRIFTNIKASTAGVLPPLETDRDPETGRAKMSDHLIAHATLEMERTPKSEDLTYSYR